MGNANSTITEILQREEASLAKFRRALRREHQLVLDDLFEAAYKHRAAASLAGHLLPFETFLLSGTLEEHAEVMRLREIPHDITRLRGEVQFLRNRTEFLEGEVQSLRNEMEKLKIAYERDYRLADRSVLTP